MVRLIFNLQYVLLPCIFSGYKVTQSLNHSLFQDDFSCLLILVCTLTVIGRLFPPPGRLNPSASFRIQQRAQLFFFSRKQTLSSKMPSVWFPVLTRIIKLLYRIQLFLYLEFLGPSPVYRWVIRLLGRWSESQKWAECAVQSRAFTIQDQQRNILPIQSSLWCSHCYGLAHIRLLLDPGLLPR